MSDRWVSGSAFTEALHRPGGFALSVALRTHYDPSPTTRAALRERLAGCAADGLVRGFFISDRDCGPDEHSTAELAQEVLAAGAHPVVSFTLATGNRAEILDRVRTWRERGVRSLLVVTGDHPADAGGSAPHFDLDSMQTLMLLAEAAARGGGFPADLHKGCVVSPFKSSEAELMWQYARLRRKVGAGADFVVSQAGYDPRAWDELLRYCRLAGLATPAIGTVLVPDAGLARRIAAGGLPGVAMPRRLLERFSSPNTRNGLGLAAAAVAVLRGLGFRGALLSGRALAPAEVRAIAQEAERLAPSWRDCLDQFADPLPRFAYFRKDEASGLNEDRATELTRRAVPHPMYVFSRGVDHLLFGPVKPVFRLLSRVCRFCDTRPGWKKALWCLEYLSKVPLYRCRMCGDCTLYACGFFCSEARCPKRMVNGPCGGSRDGRCELPAGGTCMWVKAYDCLKTRTARPTFTAPPVPPKDRGLEGSCSWINFCLGRDHRRGRIDTHERAEDQG
ncbi:MAG TPA: methylenetetrahydrofolate reductase C-terminal domain-containing protein [bacterium]